MLPRAADTQSWVEFMKSLAVSHFYDHFVCSYVAANQNSFL